MEVKSKEDYFRLAAKHLKQAQDSVGVVQDSVGAAQDSLIEALDWLRAGAALIPDESKTIQGLKAALVESLQREEGLRARLASSEAALVESLKREKELEAKLTYSAMAELDEECRAVWRKLRESVEREKDMQRQVILYVESERRLVAALESLLREARKPTPNDSVEVCCQNFKECNKPCVPRAEHWKWRAKESERIGREHQWYKQWRTPDASCNAEPVKPSGSSNTSVPPN